jgi:hypothetical protein
MMSQPTLADRARRAAERATTGAAVLLVVQADELPEAKKLIGDAPCIVCTGEDAVKFLEWMRKPRRRGG